jgi:hypothetical protein
MGEEKIKITKPALSTGIKVSGNNVSTKPGRRPGTAALHLDLPHFNLPNGGDGNHFDVAHSDTTWKKVNKTITIKGRLTKDDMLKLAKTGATITNCKISVDAKSLKALNSFLETKKG